MPRVPVELADTTLRLCQEDATLMRRIGKPREYYDEVIVAKALGAMGVQPPYGQKEIDTADEVATMVLRHLEQESNKRRM